MPSPVEICNLALQHLGESSIISLDDTGDKVSRTCAVNFSQARDEVLQSVAWSCAKKQAELSKLSAVPLYKWSAAYQLPGDFLRLVEINGEDAWHPQEYFDRMGDTLVLGEAVNDDEGPDSIAIEYIFRQTDTTRFDPLLVECLALVLAMKMARILTGSDTKGQDLRREYEQIVLPRARNLNASQLYTGKNHPLRQRLRRSLLNRGDVFGRAPSAANPPGAATPIPEEISDWSGEID